MKSAILIVDDEAAQRQLLTSVLAKQYVVETAENGVEAIKRLGARRFDLVITDERMPEMNGIALIQWLRCNTPATPIIVLTAYGSIKTAVEAIKLGADEYLTKPLRDPNELRQTVRKVLCERRAVPHEAAVDDATANESGTDIIVRSAAMTHVVNLAEKVAVQPTTLLITGESGVGKEVLARFVHARSRRSEQPFVAVNCAALTETLLSSELFGHEKGAFTGAADTKRGRFELADGGTLFLDEIGEMSVDLQTTFLRVLQEQQFERVGGSRTITVDVRVIAATNRDLQQSIRDGLFREDLYYRLNVFPLHIPPLRERRDDIEPLSEYFLNRLSVRMGHGLKSLDPHVKQVFHTYDWPGNIRELQNAIERALIVAVGDVILPADLPHQLLQQHGGGSAGRTLSDFEKDAILKALSDNGNDRRKAADQLGISLRTLQSRLKEYGLTRRQ